MEELWWWLLGVAACASCAAGAAAADPPVAAARRIGGYRGIWFDLQQRTPYGSKYSGGLGTYTAKHHPLAVYAPEAKKTFFVYGGTPDADKTHLLAMIAYYDHETGMVPKPAVVHDKQGIRDPHDNPSLNIDQDGHLWVFVSGRGRARPGFVYRSTAPYSIDAFEQVRETELTYPQPWWIKDEGFLLLFTKYTRGRELYWATSRDGRTWSPDHKLATMGGHYQVSNHRDGRVITAFNRHPGGTPDKRTDLYFAQTADMGSTWTTAAGEALQTPITDHASPALVRNYASEKRLVYVKDIGFDAKGRPAILYITSRDFRPGPDVERTWTIAHWQGDRWAFREVARAWHNYDMGSLYIEPEGRWRIIAPMEPGPQRWGTGGEIALWLSDNEGMNWRKVRDVTRSSERNHAYARRPVDAHADFYAFWADGNPDELSISRLYFTNREGGKVFCLPYEMDTDLAKPEELASPDDEAEADTAADGD